MLKFIPFFILIPNLSFASTELEHQSLHLLQNQLRSLDAVIIKAKTQANFNQKIRFDYKHLQEDLQSIIQGINMHLNKPMQARENKLIKGNYTRYKQ